MKDIELQTEAFKRYIEECDELSITPDYAGAFNAAWIARAAVESDRAQRVPDGYEQGSAECMAAVQQILDGKDRGEGVANEPWESTRRRLIALVAPAPAQQERKPMTYREIADATSEWAHVRSDYTIGIIRAAERHHGIKE